MNTDPKPAGENLGAAGGHTRAIRVVLLYAGFASLWILSSDKVLEWLVDAPATVTSASILKGWLFVVVTSVFLYGLLLRPAPGSVDIDSHPPLRTLRWPMALITIVVIALTAAAITFTLGEGREKQAIELLAVTKAKGRLIEHWLSERHADAQMVRSTPFSVEHYRRWRETGDSLDRDRTVGLLRAYLEHEGLHDALLLDAQATPVWSATGDPTRIMPIQRDAILGAVDQDRIRRLGPYSDAGGLSLVDFIIPLAGSDSVDHSAVILRVDARKQLFPLLGNGPDSNQAGETLLFRRDGDHIEFLNDVYPSADRAGGRLVPLGARELLAAQVLRAADQLGRIIEGVDYRGVPVTGVVLPVAGTDWFLLSKLDRAEIYKGMLTEVLWIAFVGFLALAAGWVTMRLAGKRYELALALQKADRDALLRQMSGMAHIGAWEFDPATGRGSWTEETARIHEVPPEQGTSVEFGLSFFQGESRARIEQAIRQAVETGTPYDLELELLTAKGGRKWVRNLGLPVMKDGRVVRMQGATQDITERKQTEMLLQRERSLLKTLIQSLPDLVWLKDPDGVYITCNPRFERFFGASELEIAGKTDYDFVDRELADYFRENDLAVIAAGGPLVNQEVVPFAEDGHVERLETVKTPMYDAQGRLIGVLGIGRNITGLYEAQEALRVAHDRNQRYLDTLQSLMVALDTDGRITMINRAGCALLGYAEDELLGRSWFETCLPQPEGIEEVYPVFRAILASGAGRSEYEYYENPVQCRNGSRRMIAWHSGVIVDDLGQPVGVLASGEDVTERRQAEQALRESEAHIRMLLESIAGAIYGTDTEGRFTFVNPACVRLLGYEHEDQLLGKPSHAVMHYSHPDGSAYPHTECRIYEAFRSNREMHVDNEVFWRRDGIPIAVEYWAYPVRRGDEVVGTVVSWLDVTERRAAEVQVRQLSQAVEQSFESIVITDVDGRIEYVNEAFLRNTGYSRDEVIGQNPRVLQSGRTPKQTYTELWAKLVSGQPWKGTFYNRRRDGSEYVEFAVISPIRGEDGRITHFVAAKEDITEKQRNGEELDRYRHHLEELVSERTSELAEASARAEAANRAKSAFLANMSHEIRTPMNGVIGLLDVLERGELSEQQNELVRIIRQSAGTLLGIIDDVLDFSKIEAGRMELEHVPVAIAEVVEDVCSALAVTAFHKDVDLDVFVDPQIPAVLSDGLRLRQVLFHLIGNAIKFSAGQNARQGRVWVAAKVLNDAPLRLRFRVEDNGIGMAPDTIQNIFNAFTQAEISTTRRFGGTGLGLAICGRVVGLMQGEIGVDSSLGAGARFTVDLPFERAPERPAPNDPDLTGVHCVLVETDRRTTDGMAVYLQHAGATVSRLSTRKARQPLPADTPGPTVLICPDDAQGESLMKAVSELPADTPVLLITRGDRRGGCAGRPDMISIDGNGLRRKVLLRNVAVAAGLASPELASPFAETTVAVSPDARPSVAEARAQGRLILVAEDDPVNQMVILEQLGMLGYAAEVAHDGAEALELWRDGGYALLLTDLHMPKMDGYELTRTIRAEEAGQRLPILALTANALRGEAKRAQAADMDDYLTKPVQLERLARALDRWLPLGAASAALDEPEETAREQPSPAVSAAGVVDLSVLKGLIGDSPELINELLRSYRDTARGYAADLEEANAAGDLAEVGAIAHKLKSASRSVGALVLGDLCAGLESAAKGTENRTVQRRLSEFSTAFKAVDKALEHLLKEG